MIDLVIPVAASSLLQFSDIKESKEKWTGSIQFNGASASGNTNNTVVGGRFTAARTFGALTHAFDASGNFTQATLVRDGVEQRDVTQNRWHTQYRLEVNAGERSFFYGRARYEEDQFSGFDRQAFLGGGFGHAFAESDARTFSVLIGPGVQFLRRARPDPVPATFVMDETNFAVFLGQNYTQVLRENVTFEQSFDGTASETNSTAASRVALKTDLTDKISSRMSYEVTHNTNPPSGRERTDTLLSASIGFQF
ncbi:MAG: DUF481 domain-containing protein [Pseudomonadota bacterium]